jgi:hypothetical protein
MAKFERLLIPIVLVVMLGAFLLEGVGPTGVRSIAIGVGAVLALAIVVGMIHRVRKKGSAPIPGPEDVQTSKDDRSPPQGPPA